MQNHGQPDLNVRISAIEFRVVDCVPVVVNLMRPPANGRFAFHQNPLMRTQNTQIESAETSLIHYRPRIINHNHF